MEPNRRWYDPIVEIYSNLLTPSTRCSAAGYDLANHRWYRLKIEEEIDDDEWLSSTIAEYIRKYSATHSAAPPWNTIRLQHRLT